MRTFRNKGCSKKFWKVYTTILFFATVTSMLMTGYIFTFGNVQEHAIPGHPIKTINNLSTHKLLKRHKKHSTKPSTKETQNLVTDVKYATVAPDVKYDLKQCTETAKKFGGTFEQNLRKIENLQFPEAEPWLVKLEHDIIAANMTRYIASFPILVTGASSRFFDVSQGLIKTIHELLMPKYSQLKFIYYDLGLTKEQRTLILFKEFGHVWWVDSSVRFMTDNLDGPLEYLRNTSSLFFTYGNTLSVAKHTRLTTFNYFKEHPCPYGEIGEIEAGNVAFYNSRVSRAIILKWVSCALTKNCIQPPGNSVVCRINTRIVGDCHRYDQSALSIILRRLYHKQNDYPLVTKPFRIIKVMRGQAVQYFKNLTKT